MIDLDYKAFMSDKSFYKRIARLSQGSKGKPAAKSSKEKQTFYGYKHFASDLVCNLEAYANFEIEVKEYAREYTQNLRVLNKYTQADFFESLRPATNEEKLRDLFDKTPGRSGYPLFSTANKKFIIKQISEYEKTTLLETFLIPYHEHVIHNSSFICRILGLFGIGVKYQNLY